MKKPVVLLSALTLLLLVLAPAALARRATETYELHMDVPNVARAPNGDRVEVTGGGVFSVFPKSVEAEGEFTHTDSAGNVLGGGTWEATQLLAYQSYGCGVVLGNELPPNFCGGMLKMRVLLTTPSGEFKGILTVFCIIGPNPPNSHDDLSEEGVTLNIVGVINFNKVVGGMNIYIRTS